MKTKIEQQQTVWKFPKIMANCMPISTVNEINPYAH